MRFWRLGCNKKRMPSNLVDRFNKGQAEHLSRFHEWLDLDEDIVTLSLLEEKILS